MKYVVPILVLLITGCSTTLQFNNTPTLSEDFKKPIEEIRSSYSDVALYEETIFLGAGKGKGDYENLVSKWGKPDKIEKDWGGKLTELLVGAAVLAIPGGASWEALVVLGAIFPYPNENNTWKKGGYEITALTHKVPGFGYKKVVNKWEWNESSAIENARDTLAENR